LAIGKRNLSGHPVGPRQLRPIVDRKIFNSRGALVAIAVGPAILDLKGKKLYDLRGINIYKLSGELVGHLANALGTDKHLDKATDKLFPSN
jgi:hypothetical protein